MALIGDCAQNYLFNTSKLEVNSMYASLKNKKQTKVDSIEYMHSLMPDGICRWKRNTNRSGLTTQKSGYYLTRVQILISKYSMLRMMNKH